MKTSFIHAADLHLGLPVTRFDKERAERIRGARIQAMENILAEAESRNADFVVIAGDVFDDNAIDATTSRRAFHILNASRVPVFILPGNHDPLSPGSVWERDPWVQSTTKTIHVFRDSNPLQIDPAIVLFPCPVYRKTSLEDPTTCIPARSNGENDHTVRIGIAHGSLKDRENLPADDHLIDVRGAEDRGLDYLALGHWHKQSFHADSEGICRIAYPGTPEPMGFRDSESKFLSSFSRGQVANRDELLDDGVGHALHVSVDKTSGKTDIESIEIGHLRWVSESRELRTEQELGQLIHDLATDPFRERSLLRMSLSGVLDAITMLRLDELKAVLAERYVHAELDTSRLHLLPSEEELREAAGSGILSIILERLAREAQDHRHPGESIPSCGNAAVAERAMMLLFQIAREVHK